MNLVRLRAGNFRFVRFARIYCLGPQLREDAMELKAVYGQYPREGGDPVKQIVSSPHQAISLRLWFFTGLQSAREHLS